MRVQAESDETKIVLHTTIDTFLERGVKLSDLMDRCEMQTRLFMKTAKKVVLLQSVSWLQ